MKFGEALEAAKHGSPIARRGWNGKNMYVYLTKGSVEYDPTIEKPMVTDINGVPAALFDRGDVGTITRNPYLSMMSAQGTVIPGWLASQTDLLAEDWEVIA